MRMSEHIDKLAAAMSKAIAEIKDAAKSGKNPYFNDKPYATYGDILDAVRYPVESEVRVGAWFPFHDYKLFTS